MFYGSVQPWLCNAANQARSTVDATLDRLEAAGWILSHGRTRRADGTETPNHYEVLEHDEWMKEHPHCCPDYKFAPDQETAEQFGVSRGDKLGAWLPPRNFWDLSTPLGSGLAKIMSSDNETTAAMIITDEESAALNKVLSKLKPFPVHREGATPGPPESPVPVHRNDHSRSTVRNPSQPTTVNKPHTPTHPTAATIVEKPVAAKPGEVSVCVDKKTLSEEELDKKLDELIEAFVMKDGDPPQVTKVQRTEMKALLKRDGFDKFRAAARAWLAANPWDARTTHPFASFIGGYAGYAAKKQIDDKKEAARITPVQIDQIGLIAFARHTKMWGRTDFDADDLAFLDRFGSTDYKRSNEDFERVRQIQLKPRPEKPDDDEPSADDFV